MSYRNLVIDGETYQYVVGEHYVKVRGMDAVHKNQVGQITKKFKDGKLVEKTIVTPAHVKAFIKGEEKPEVEICGCGENNGVILTCDPFSVEIHEDYTEYWMCPRCIHEREMDI